MVCVGGGGGGGGGGWWWLGVRCERNLNATVKYTQPNQHVGTQWFVVRELRAGQVLTDRSNNCQHVRLGNRFQSNTVKRGIVTADSLSMRVCVVRFSGALVLWP